MSKASKWDELEQLQEAYAAIRTQPYEGQRRMVDWLSDRIEADRRQALEARENAARERIAKMNRKAAAIKSAGG